MPFVITSQTNPLGAGPFDSAEAAGAYVLDLLLQGTELEPGLRIVELEPDAGLMSRTQPINDLLRAVTDAVRACEQLARKGRVSTARAVADPLRAVMVSAGLLEPAEARSPVAQAYLEQIRSAQRKPAAVDVEPSSEPDHEEPPEATPHR